MKGIALLFQITNLFLPVFLFYGRRNNEELKFKLTFDMLKVWSESADMDS